MSEFRARIIAELDTSKINKQITSQIEGKKFKLSNITLDTKGLNTKIQKALNGHQFTLNSTNVKVDNLSKTITGQMKNAGNQAGQQFSQSLLSRINTQIRNGGIEASISRVQQKFTALQGTIKNLESGSISGQLHSKLAQIETDLTHLNSLEKQFSNSGSMSTEQLVLNWKDYEQTLSKVKNNINTVTSTTKQFASTIEIATLQNRMESWITNNSKATKEYGSQVQGFISKLKQLSVQGNVSKNDLNQLANSFKLIDQAAESAGLKGKTFGDRLKGAFSSISEYVSASTLIYAAFNAIKNGISEIVDLDTALVDLQKTTDGTAQQLKEFYFTANDSAKALGVSTKDVIQASAEWSRLGYNIKEAQIMAETSSVFASISPGMDIETATDGLVSAMKAFDIEADDALDGIASKINAIGNSQAVSNEDIVNFLTRSSSAMKEANNTLEETIALGTAATEITRNADSVGNAMKTLSMRIRGYDEETEEYIGGVEELSGAIADLTKTSNSPGGISLFRDEEKTEYKSTVELLRDISKIYDELTDKQQANLLEKLAGKRQGQNVAAMLNNFEAVENSLETMQNSAGSAMREMDIIQQSLEYKTNALKETTTGIFQNLFQRADMGAVVDTFTAALNILDQLTSKLGLFGTALIAVGITAFVKNFDSLKMLGIQGSESIDLVTAATARMSEEDLVASLSKTSLNKEQLKAVLLNHGLAEAEAEKTATTIASSAANVTATATTAGLTTATGSLTASFNGLKAAMMSNPITAVITTLLTLLTVVWQVSNAFGQAAEEIEQKATEASNAIKQLSDDFKSTSDTVSNISRRFAELAQGVDSVTGKNLSLTSSDYAEFVDLSNQLAELFPTLTRHYDENGNAIVDLSGDVDTIVGSLNNLLEVQRQITNKEISENIPDLYFGILSKSRNYKADMAEYNSEMTELQNTYERLNSKDFTIDLNELLDNSLVKIEGSNDSLYQLDEIASDYLAVLDKLGLQYEYLSSEYTTNENGIEVPIEFNYRITSFDGMSDEEIATAKGQIEEGFQGLVAKYATEIGNFQNQILTTKNQNKANWASLLSSLTAWLSTDTAYQVLSDDMQSVVQSMLNNVDFAELNFDNWDKASDYIRENIIEKIQNASLEIQQAFSDMFSIKKDDKTAQEYIDAIKEKAQYIADNSDYEFDDVLKSTGFKDIIDAYETSAQDVMRSLDGVTKEMVYSLSPDEVTKAFDYINNYGIKTWDELQEALSNKMFEKSINLEVETEGLNNLNNALSESASSTGLTAESVENLTSRYQNLEGHENTLANLFERTTTGIHLNTKAAKELEKAYAEQNKSDLENKLKGLKDKYNDLTLEMDNCANASERATLYDQRDNILQQINDTADLISQYDALTSSYNAWQEAQSATDQRDMYSNLASGYESIKKLIDQGWYNDSEVNTYLDTMLNASQRTKDNYADFQKLTEQIEGTSFSIADFFKYDEDNNLVTDGLFDFFDTVKAKLGDDFVQITEDGDYAWDFTGDKVKKVADALGMSTEAVEILEKAMGDVTENTNLDSFVANLDGLAEGMSDRVESLKKALGSNAEDYDLGSFNFGSFDTKDLETQISNIKSVIDGEFKNSDGKIDLSIDGADEAVSILASLVARKQEINQPAVMDVDTSKLSGEVQDTMQSLQELQTNFNNLELGEILNMDTSDIENKIRDVATTLDTLPNDTKKKLSLDTDEVQSAIDTITSKDVIVNGKVQLPEDAVNTLKSAVEKISPDMMVKIGVNSEAIDNYDPDDKTKKVTYLLESKEVDKYDPKNHERTVTYSLIKTSDLREFNPKDITRTVTYDIKTNGSVPSKAQGTAYANGNWGTKDSGVALGGEIGQELVVRNGRFFTIGDDGAEFFAYKKGDIIFNAEQTRQILANGKITNGKKRGVAYLEGTAFGSGSNANRRRSSGSSHSVSSSSSKSSSSNSSSTSSNNSSDDKEPEVFNWIEIAINRIERAISNLGRKAESTFKKLSTRISSTNKEISKVNEEINLQQKAADRYMKQAKSVGLSSSLAKKVQNGTIDINEYDEDTQKLINDYKEWYEKSLDCKDAIEELHESLAQLYEDNFNNTQTDYENQLSLIEHLANTYNNGLDLLETKGYLASTKYYAALKDAEKQNINVLNNELADLEKRFSEAMNSGEIEKYSEAWYSMQTTINDVKESIDEANVSLAEYAKTMRELEWSYFDYAQDRISQITQEADFLINLMSNSDLYDDKGQLNNTGMATMGLHGQNYNVYMAQADQYAEELLAINKELAKDPYNTDLIARREELLGLQQDSIEAAEKEKQAIVDMVEEGINLELAALKDLIDTYTDALDSAKNLYDYQKKVKDKTSEIASLEKQFMAYKNDISEETRATVQKLKVELENAKEDLQETEYEQFISDQKKLLDDLYTQYEEIINQRLDNVDALIGDMIDVVNANTEIINQTLTDTADSVGYTLSDNLREIWDGSTGALDGTIAKYGDDFSAQFTSVNTVLSNIETLIRSMVDKSNETATSKVNDTKTTTAPKTSAKTETKKNTSNKSNEKKITVGGKINAKGAKIYANSYGGGASTQYFASDPIYTVLGENNGYYKVRWHKASSGVTGWFKKGDVKAYKTGGLVDFTGLAQLDGTPDKPELVLNPKDTENFIGLRDTLRTMAEQPLSILGSNHDSQFLGMETPSITLFGIKDIEKDIAALSSPNINQNNNITINNQIDHVEDYDDLVEQMKKDRKFEKMIKAITIDPLIGRSEMAKNNIHWK